MILHSCSFFGKTIVVLTDCGGFMHRAERNTLYNNQILHSGEYKLIIYSDTM